MWINKIVAHIHQVFNFQRRQPQGTNTLISGIFPISKGTYTNVTCAGSVFLLAGKKRNMMNVVSYRHDLSKDTLCLL